MKFLVTVVMAILLLNLVTFCSKDGDDDGSSAEIKDSDGNTYKTVTIGTQVWMTENLKTTKYSDGSTIELIINDSIWINTVLSDKAGYCWYDHDINNKNPYGAIYNGFAVMTDKLCPTGWHVPSRDEWLALISYAGGLDVAGGKLKEKGTSHWLAPNTGATDSLGFKALPGGYRENFGTFNLLGLYGRWWSSTQNASGEEYCSHFNLENDESSISYYAEEWNHGFSVRCVKD